ncbi:MFS transporter [Lysinibacter sp. HNR]|uniref:MFS transporter n=1 Tax=Lysinibacter sp. HNR TaxID=3031408 RepID=UPI002435719B|nr:MFS transporter [Lysinibacter sp. HNR]WGD37394.1 MFS transporter [Lysinibacter sp. HNR]
MTPHPSASPETAELLVPPTRKHTTSTHGKNNSWRNAVFAVFALAGFSLSTWLSRIPTVRDHLDATSGEMGLVYLGISVGSIIGLLGSGYVVTLIGAKKAITWFLTIGVIGLPLAALAIGIHSIPLTIAALAFFGIGFSMTDVAMNVTGAANERAIGRTLMPIFHALFSVGTVIGIGLGALAEATQIPLLLHMVIAGAIIAALTLLIVRFLPRGDGFDTPDEQPASADQDSTGRSGWKSALGVWTKKRTLLIGLIVLGMAFVEGAANDWLPLAMIDGYDLTTPSARPPWDSSSWP